jgi:tripartite-type tricarboxylate transporter receptor subunit TctC
MNKIRRQMLIGGTIIGAGFGVNVFASPGYPARAVKVVIPYPPGGPTDIVGRIVCTQ